MILATLVSLVTTRSVARFYDLAIGVAVTPVPTQPASYGISGAAWDVNSDETHVSVEVSDDEGHTVPVVLEFIQSADPTAVLPRPPRSGPYCAAQTVSLPTGTIRVVAHLGPHKDAACLGPGTSGTVTATFYKP